MKIFWGSVLVALALLTGCAPSASDAGNEYIGRWEALVLGGTAKAQYEVSRNGKNFLIRKEVRGVGEDYWLTITLPATYEDDFLKSRDWTLVIDKKSGKLISSDVVNPQNIEYMRVK